MQKPRRSFWQRNFVMFVMAFCTVLNQSLTKRTLFTKYFVVCFFFQRFSAGDVK
jgi:hypothetical protein